MANAIRDRIASGGVALGLIVRLAKSGEIARIARASDHDFLFIDGQHAAFSKETVARLIQASLDCGVTPLVRVRGPADPNIALWLDCGAGGVIAPDLKGAAEAERMVEACRFAPEGKRSYPGALIQHDYRPVELAAALEAINRDTLCVGMIETTEALGEIDEIAAVRGLDVLHVGLADLSIALGSPGDPGAAIVTEAVASIAAAAARHGKILGIGGDRDPARRRAYVEAGARFMTTDIDINLLLQGATEAVRRIRQPR